MLINKMIIYLHYQSNPQKKKKIFYKSQ